jgi:hypothetical protein
MPDRLTAVLTGLDRIARIGAKKPQRMLLTKRVKAVVSFSYKRARVRFLPQCVFVGV